MQAASDPLYGLGNGKGLTRLDFWNVLWNGKGLTRLLTSTVVILRRGAGANQSSFDLGGQGRSV